MDAFEAHQRQTTVYVDRDFFRQCLAYLKKHHDPGEQDYPIVLSYADGQLTIAGAGERVLCPAEGCWQDGFQIGARELLFAMPKRFRRPTLTLQNDEGRLSGVAQTHVRLYQAPLAAKILGVHQTTLVRWAKQGRIPAYASPGKARTIWLFDLDEITSELREHSLTISRKRRNLIESPSLSREKIQKIAREIRAKNLSKPAIR